MQWDFSLRIEAMARSATGLDLFKMEEEMIIHVNGMFQFSFDGQYVRSIHLLVNVPGARYDRED